MNAPGASMVLYSLLWGLLEGSAPVTAPSSGESQPPSADDGRRLIIRLDDIGFCHAANMAIKQVLEEGVCTSVSVIVNTPWLDEAVQILHDHPHVSVGVHLALNSEWREYRWGPVAPYTEVPSLVDADGKFFGSRQALMANNPKVEEVEKELRAQIELALRKGLRISYLDYHMGAAMATREFQEVVEKLAGEFGLGISQYFGEKYLPTVYRTPPEEKLTEAIDIVESLGGPGLYLFVLHPGMNTPEMAALSDLNSTGVKDMAAHRQAATDLLCASAFKEAIKRQDVKLVGYQGLQAEGLNRMKRPWVADPYGTVQKRTASQADTKPLRLIPYPKQVERTPGTFAFASGVTLAAQLPQDHLAVAQFVSEVEQAYGIRIKRGKPSGQPSISIRIADEGSAIYGETGSLQIPTAGLGPQGYLLAVTPDGIRLMAPGEPGVFYGIQTLRQLIRANSSGKSIPCCRIVDWPSFAYRGWQDDISRGPIPTMENLKLQIRSLSEAKLNLVTLYTEHVFRLDKHPKIAPADGITAAEVKELVSYAKQHHVEVVGNFQSFGHFRNILRLPEYAGMGENDWVLSPALEENYAFLADVYSEIAPAYESALFNINCDETWGLGTGASKAMVDSMGIGAVYAGHISRVAALLRPYGKRPMMWGDIAAKHPEVMSQLPEDLILLAWNYRAQEDFDKQIKPAIESGFEFMVCPGVSGWRWLWPRFDVATVNIHNFIREGARHGAMGVLTTSWDDSGEPFFGSFWYPFYWAAECSWTAPSPAESAGQGVTARGQRLASFGRSFAPVFYGNDDDRITQRLQDLAKLGTRPFMSNLHTNVFWEGPAAKQVREARPRTEEVAEFVAQATAVIGDLETQTARTQRNRHSLEVALFAARQALFLGQRWKAILDSLDDVNALAKADQHEAIRTLENMAPRFKRLGEQVGRLRADYSRLWAAEYRPWWLDNNQAKYDHLAEELASQVQRVNRSREELISSGIMPTAESLGLTLPASSAQE